MICAKLAGVLSRYGRPVRAPPRQRVVGVGDRKNAGRQRDIFTFECFRIAGAVPIFVMIFDRRDDRRIKTNFFQDRGTDRSMDLYFPASSASVPQLY